MVQGAGIRGLVTDGERTRLVAVGSERFLEEGQHDLPWLKHAVTLEEQGNTIAFVLIDGEPAGILAIADQIRPEVPGALAALRTRGVKKFVMLTGDNARTAAAVAEQAGINQDDDEVMAQLLPQEKMTRVSELKSQGHNVAMIGDGVNDAPAIAASDVGLAMGAGTDVSLETADVVLVGSRFDQLIQARSVSRATLWNMAQNTVIALGTVAFLLTGVVLPQVNMASGMLIHEISVIAVILNAMRLIRYKDKAAASLTREAAPAPAKGAELTAQTTGT